MNKTKIDWATMHGRGVSGQRERMRRFEKTDL